VKGYNQFITERLELEFGKDQFSNLAPVQKKEQSLAVPESDKQLAAMLVKRDAFNLAASLEIINGQQNLFTLYIRDWSGGYGSFYYNNSNDH
jgi:hypothetical protein